MTTQSKFSWQRAPMPWDEFPMGSGGSLRLGLSWKWFVAGGASSPHRTLFAADPLKEEYRIWRCRTGRDSSTLLIRIEHHGAVPGWHAHSRSDGASAFLADRQPVSSKQFPAIASAGLWRAEGAGERRPAFPAEPISEDMVAHLGELLGNPSEDVTLRPVPFGLAVGLTERRMLGDSLTVYVSQLGRKTPVFRLEDDGMTIPALQSGGALASGDYLLPHEVLGRHTAGRTHFSPDMRTLFTPYFPADELPGRLTEFAQFLSTYAAILNAHESGHAGRPQASDPAVRPMNRPAAEPREKTRGGSPLPNGNAWTRAASCVTV